MALVLRKKNICEILVFIIITSLFFRLDNYPVIEMTYSLISLVVMFFAFLLWWRSALAVWKFILVEIVFYLYIIINTYYNGYDANYYAQFSLCLKNISLVVVLMECSRYGLKEPLKILARSLSLMLVLNFIQILLFPSIMGSSDGKMLYLISGNYNQFGGPIVLLLLLLFLLTKDGFKWNLYCVFMLLISLSTVLICGSVTTSVAVVVIALYYFIARNNKFLSSLSSVLMLTVVVLVFLDFVLSDIDVLGNQSFLEYFFDYTGKDSSFSGRSEVWSHSISLILSNPVSGVGLYAGDMARSILNVYNAHNILLDLLLVGGFLLLVPIAFLVCDLICKMKNSLMPYYYYGEVFILNVFLLMLQFEVYSYYVIFLFIFVIYYSINVFDFKKC